VETRAHYVAVGAFVLAMIVLAFGVVVWLGRVELSQDLRQYYIFFKGSVSGLSKGAAVQYNGIPVGRLTDIRVDPDNVEQVQVTVEIDTGLVDIKSDARAYLETNILSGVSTIQIRGGTLGAAPLEPKPGHRYPVIEAGKSELEQVKATLPELMGSLKDAAQRLNDLLNDENRQAIADSIENVRKVTGVFADQSKGVAEVVANANAAVLALHALLQNLERSYAEHGGLKDQVSQTLAGYDKVARNLVEASRQLQLAVQENRPGIRDFSQRTLPDINDLVSNVQRLVATLTRFASELERDPTRLIYGDRREGYRPR
jgi:phospholipid/cholesterol/gamma-HCH transport system substrate-binding protein